MTLQHGELSENQSNHVNLDQLLSNLCEASLVIIKAFIAKIPNASTITFAQIRAEIDALPPGLLESLEGQCPGFTNLLWLCAAYAELGPEKTDELIYEMTNRFSKLLAVS